MKLQWPSKPWFQVVLHTILWTLLFSLPFLLRPDYEPQTERKGMVNDTGYFLQYAVNCITWVVLFYLNAFVLIPRLIYRRKYGCYILAQTVVFLVLLLINWVSFRLLVPYGHFSLRGFAFFYFFPCLFMLATSTAFKMFQDKTETERVAKERETETLKTELLFLRSQVSPHFMFNVLNNMVALARKKSDELEPSLMKLSSLLRYMLYETDSDKVPLWRETEYLRSYIDLQQQRFGKSVEVQAELPELEDVSTIEPMLLIPFVENAFKHGTGLIGQARIEIFMKVEDHRLHFTVRNRYHHDPEEVKDKTSGIGLANVKRRLNLLYEGNYNLLIDKSRDWFTVDLQLNLR